MEKQIKKINGLKSEISRNEIILSNMWSDTQKFNYTINMTKIEISNVEVQIKYQSEYNKDNNIYTELKYIELSKLEEQLISLESELIVNNTKELNILKKNNKLRIQICNLKNN